ncbi:hypothetical protein HQ585_17910, partial [candidate division KSB1 bacterium]|nr:hypothetical protein [candidate division KSB1 bacterium]
MRRFIYIPTIVFLMALPLVLLAQMDDLHGDQNYSMSGLHSGNMIRTTFWNDGQLGQRVNSPEDIPGEWPINSGRAYNAKTVILVQGEVKDIYGETKHIQSEANGTRTGGQDNSESNGDWGPNGEWWTFCPLPGFANMEPTEEQSDKPRVAMSHWDWSWPQTWPDKYDDPVDPGWSKSWNGYFGKNVLNADQESYYVVDDYNNREFAFYPDSTDSLRRGLGMRVTIRGFQWSNVLVEDILFMLYDVKNIGTHNHDKLNFGIMSCPGIGATTSAADNTDDGGRYDLEEDFGYHYDENNIGAGGWSPVGLYGLAYFESPGNPYDGIDNDGDGGFNGGSTIDESMFEPVTYQIGEDVVVIDYQNEFSRSVVPMPEEGITVNYLGSETLFLPNVPLPEQKNNLIDDNLNGIIDENNGEVFGEGESAIERYLYLGLNYINYKTNDGVDNILIDERRDDGIDNDGDWDVLNDDVGLD